MQLSSVAAAVITDAWYRSACDPSAAYATEAAVLTADDAITELADTLCRPTCHPSAAHTTQTTSHITGTYHAYTGPPNAGNRPSSHPSTPNPSRDSTLSVG